MHRYFKHFLIVTMLPLLYYSVSCKDDKQYSRMQPPVPTKRSNQYSRAAFPLYPFILRSHKADLHSLHCGSAGSSAHHTMGWLHQLPSLFTHSHSNFGCCQLCFPGTDTWPHWELGSGNQLVSFTAMRKNIQIPSSTDSLTMLLRIPQVSNIVTPPRFYHALKLVLILQVFKIAAVLTAHIILQPATHCIEPNVNKGFPQQ